MPTELAEASAALADAHRQIEASSRHRDSLVARLAVLEEAKQLKEQLEPVRTRQRSVAVEAGCYNQSYAC